MNAAEQAFWSRAKASGWQLSKRGWPDFFCWKDDQVMVVEVKPSNRKLRRDQRVVLDFLASKGIDCYVWKPTGSWERVQHR